VSIQQTHWVCGSLFEHRQADFHEICPKLV